MGVERQGEKKGGRGELRDKDRKGGRGELIDKERKKEESGS